MRVGRFRFPQQTLGCTAILLTIGLFAIAPEAAASQYTLLHSFTGGHDGGVPYASLITDADGALYGTTSVGGTDNLGTVFKLIPPTAGKTVWQETLLHSFTGGKDSGLPRGALVFDHFGALYGTTYGYKDYGSVFELLPPADGHTIWSYKLLHSFDGTDGWHPAYGALIFDTSGNLYGTTLLGREHDGLGNVFSLAPPAVGETVWRLKILHQFFDGSHKSKVDAYEPYGGLVFDGTGALYGPTLLGPGTYVSNQCGTIYKLSAPAAGGSVWQETFPLKFTCGSSGGQPYSSPIIDSSGRLYGTANWGGLIGSNGEDGGTVYMLVPPPAGKTAWTETTLYQFEGVAGSTNPTDGTNPIAPLVMGSSGDLYGTTQYGGIGCPATAGELLPGCGTVFRLAPPAAGKTSWTETVLYRFTGTEDGAYPYAGLVIKDGALYGGTSGGGTSGKGTIFKIVP